MCYKIILILGSNKRVQISMLIYRNISIITETQICNIRMNCPNIIYRNAINADIRPVSLDRRYE